jgi:hypothetical protein
MVTPQTMPWIDAELFCESAHGQLASFSSSANFQAVFDYYHDLGWISDDTWIGMYDITSEGTYQWTDGSATAFTNWAASQPDDATGGFNCVEAYGDGTWNDQDCSAGFTGICKYAATVTPLEFGTNHHHLSLAQEHHQQLTLLLLSTLTQFNLAVGNCPAGFRYMYDGCYQVNTEPQRWITASESALSKSAMLASIHSLEQNRWLTEHLKRIGWLSVDVWIGTNDISAESTWAQADGSAADYTNWDPYSPDNENNAQNCVSFKTDSTWSDDYCWSPKPSLMKYSTSATQQPESK